MCGSGNPFDWNAGNAADGGAWTENSVYPNGIYNWLFGLGRFAAGKWFFSKELILEAGAEHGPAFAYWGMVVLAGVTAIYSLRMTVLVFYGRRYDDRPLQRVPRAMRVVLAVLAVGTGLSWLLAGPFSKVLNASLPFHAIYSIRSIKLAIDILIAPETWLVLLVIALAAGIWLAAVRFGWKVSDSMMEYIRSGMGFETINRGVVGFVDGFSRILRRTQTGHLSWNTSGLLIGLIAVLVFLVERL